MKILLKTIFSLITDGCAFSFSKILFLCFRIDFFFYFYKYLLGKRYFHYKLVEFSTDSYKYYEFM